MLVLACLGDRLERAPASFTHIAAHACKGIGQLLRRCEEPNLLDSYARVLALCDDDEIRPHLKLPARACKLQVVAAVRSRCSDSHRLQPVLLIKNLETILDAITGLLDEDPLPRKPRPIERERILHRFVHRSTPDQRLELTRRVPSLAYLIEKLAHAVGELGL